MSEVILQTIIAGLATIAVALIGIVTAKVNKVNHELKPNSGTTVKDQTNRIERQIQTVNRKLDRDDNRLNSLESAQKDLLGASRTLNTRVGNLEGKMDIVITLLERRT